MSSGNRVQKSVNVSLECLVCGSRNYKTRRPRRLGVAALVIKKYCSTCNQHTEHREAK